MTFSLENIRERLDKDDIKPDEITISEAVKEPDFRNLSPRKCATADVTCLFADIRNSGEILNDRSRTKTAIILLNAFLRQSTLLIEEDFGGCKVQYQGDCILAVFLTPHDQPELRAYQAVRAGLGLHDLVAEINKFYSNYQDISIGVGIARGKLLLTRLGRNSKMEPVILRHAVNLASELEGKASSGEVQICEDVYKSIPDREVHKHFSKQGQLHEKDIYVASGITLSEIDKEIEESQKNLIGKGSNANVVHDSSGRQFLRASAPLEATLMETKKHRSWRK